MKKKLFSLLFIFFSISLISQTLSELGLYEKDRIRLTKNKLVLKKKKINRAPWPEVKVFAKVNATPEECAAVHFAFHDHKNFIPDLVKSEPVKYITPLNIHVYFEMNFTWSLPNSRFTTGNHLKKFGSGSYKVEWYHVKHSSAKNTSGYIAFIPFGRSTLLVYRNFTIPSSGLAGLFVKRMLKGMEKTIRSIVSRIEDIKNNHSGKMKIYKNNLKRAFKGEFIYKNLPGSRPGQAQGPDQKQ